MTAVLDLEERLNELHIRTSETPQFNPVFQLGLEISRKLESGEMSLGDIESLVAELECEGLRARALRIQRLVGPIAADQNRKKLQALASEEDFGAFAAQWQRPQAHIVFTAHPTFLMTRSQTGAVTAAASSGDMSRDLVCAASPSQDTITLDYEHEAAMAALCRAQDARDTITGGLLQTAAERWPSQWKSLRPVPVRFASWVGYDMDGRTDINWTTSIRYRLSEKAMRLTRYASALRDAGAPRDADSEIADQLDRAARLATQMADRFAQDLSDPAALSEAANALTADHPDKLVSLAPVIAALEAQASTEDNDTARKILVIAAAMQADGLGMGW
ncbi:MAG: phosphoenolpyruvate carboxylase, partial [Sphingomonadaceae bacterium]|nr:phosphoenolpyruvate carboxylase [Sphingomonadaceae bacterium]